MLKTDRLLLIPAQHEMLKHAVNGDEGGLITALSIEKIANSWTHFPDALVWMCDYLEEHPEMTDWWSYFIIHQEDNCLIGNGGYKGPPLFTGEVEIGYEIAPDYQGRGLATEAALALCHQAMVLEPTLQRIIAHTLAEENASCGVLRNNEFVFEGEYEDMEDGKIWKWVKTI